MNLPKQMASMILERLSIAESLLRVGKFDLILLYHSVEVVRSGYRYSVSAEDFRQQLRFLTQKVDVVPLEVMLKSRSDNVRIAITFDDAYADVFTDAFPLLDHFGVTATVFAPTAFIGRKADKETERVFLNQKSFLNRTQIEELHRSGRIRFESHTHTHLNCGAAPTKMAEDVSLSIDLISEFTGRRPLYFAYPNGVCSAGTHEIACKLGFQAVFTTQRRRLSKGFVHGRYDITTAVESLHQFKRNIAGINKDALRDLLLTRT
jgi:peptidoglycan/xylan/chitin deacetylase (PgdA/CDA1 family)